MFVDLRRAAIFLSLAFLDGLWRNLGVVEANQLHSTDSSQLDVYEFREHPREAYSMKKTAKCDAKYRYRLIDGQCNNLNHQDWGSSLTPLIRLLPNAYQDGKSEPRTSGVDTKPLPTAREVSVKCHSPGRVPTTHHTIMVLHWGAFIVTDIIKTPNKPDNCTCDSRSSECFNIPLSKDDEFYKYRKCIPLTRTNSVPGESSDKSERKQFNTMTAFLDASNIYGNSEAELKALRAHNGYEMRVITLGEKGDFMPPETCKKSCDYGRGQYCFLSGSQRVNLMPTLATLNTIFVREHNRIAQYLKSNTKLSDENIFQETRKIVGAIFQHISYSEFLPIILGTKVIKEEKLRISDYVYDSSIQPGIFHSFSSSAFRFGHASIPETVTLPTSNAVLPLQKLFWKPGPVFTLFGELLKTLTTHEGRAATRHFSHSVSRHLYPETHGEGRDLAALNIQRGREYGLPSYTQYRKHLGLKSLTLKDVFPHDKKAASVYRHIDDVDLFTGGLSETPLDDGMVGPTFSGLLAKQFKRLMDGDRFFFSTTDKHIAFTKAQLDEITKVKLSKVMCDNTDTKTIQEDVFRPVSDQNKLKECGKLRGLNLKVWVDEFKRNI